MKHVIKFTLFFLFCCVFISCEQDRENFKEEIEFVDNSKLKNLFNSASETLNKKNDLDWHIKSASNDQQAQIILQPVIAETKNMLNQYGISDQEIIDDYGSLDSPELIYVGMYLANDSQNQSMSSSEVVDCLLRATGIQAFHDAFWGNFTNRRMLLRAVGKFATRTLGWIGAALIVADFADCMWG